MTIINHSLHPSWHALVAFGAFLGNLGSVLLIEVMHDMHVFDLGLT